MTRHNVLNVSLILLLGQCSIVVAEKPSPLSTVVRTRMSEPRLAPTPAESPPEVSRHQIPHLSQSEYPDTFGLFSGPVLVEALVQYVLANNPEIQAARYHARALGARVPQAASLPDPQFITTVFLEEIQTAAGPQEVAMSLSQKLPWFGKRASRSEVAYHDAMVAYARVTATELKVVEEVKRAYYDVYSLRNAILETRRLQPRLEDVIQIARTKYETNVAKAGLESVFQAEIELSKLKTSLIKLEQAKTQAQARLAGTLHLPPDTRIEAVPEFDRTKVARTAEMLVSLSESYQPELDARRRETARDRTSIDLACREYWPDVTIGLNWYEIGSSGISPLASGRDAYSLSVGVNLPIYRKRLDAAVREARYKTISSARRYAAARDEVRSEVQVLYAQFIEQHKILAILEKEILPRAGQALDLTIEAYRTGTQEFQQLIDSYRTLLDYRIDYHKREAMREQAIASLERAVGCAITAGPIETEIAPKSIPVTPSQPEP